MNRIQATGTLSWADYKTYDDNEVLSLLVRVNTKGKKAEGEKYAPSITYSVRLRGSYAKAFAYIADEYKQKKFVIVFSGEMAAPTMKSRDGNMEIAPIEVLYPDIEPIEKASVDYEQAVAEEAPSAKASKSAKAADAAVTTDFF